MCRFNDQYDITLTLTYETGSEKNKPSIAIPPRFWYFSSCRPQITDQIHLYNPTPIQLDVDSIDVNVLGAQSQMGNFVPTIMPYSFITVPVTATRIAPLGAGKIDVTFSYTAASDDLVTFTFNPSSITSPYLAVGESFKQSYKLKPVTFDSGKQYSVAIWTSGKYDWLRTDRENTAVFTWDDNSEIPVELTVNPPPALTEGVYTDTVYVDVAYRDYYVAHGKLNVEITKTAYGVQVHTSYELGDIPYVRKHGTSGGIILLADVSCDGGGGEGKLPYWEWEIYGPTLIGTTHSEVTGAPPFPQYISPPVVYSDHQVVRLQISQQILLEGEGSNADLAARQHK